MILPHNSSNVNQITPEQINRTNSHHIVNKTDLRNFIGVIHSTIKSNSFHLDRSNAFKQFPPRLDYPDALTGQSITSVTQTYNTTHHSADANVTHLTMASNIVSALMDDQIKDDHHAHNRVMLLILIGIFMFISLFITIVVVLMCKKKNSVFMLQKCEQESDLELDEIEDANTDMDTSESEYEPLDPSRDKKRSESYPCLGKLKYMDEGFDDRESLQKCVDFDLFNKSMKNANLKLQSSTPLLFSSNSGNGTDSNEMPQEIMSDVNVSEHSQDKQTGSINSEKYVICLDKFSIHSQLTDSSLKQWKSSERTDNQCNQQRMTKSKTFDESPRNKQNNSYQKNPSRTGQLSTQQKGQQLKCSLHKAKPHGKHNYTFQILNKDRVEHPEETSVVFDECVEKHTFMCKPTVDQPPDSNPLPSTSSR